MCQACQRIVEVRLGQNPFFVAELRETIAVVHDHQPLRGWVVLLLKAHAEHFDQLGRSVQLGVMEDLADAASCVRRATGCRRLNYECLGNVMAHVHWHLIPRFEPPTDPEPGRTVWTRPEAWLNCGVLPDERDALVQQLRRAGLVSR
jgi:diadenosine tetraphosphate (Ap4A) HIT family hydrolase